MFFSHSQKVLTAKQRSIRAIAYDFGTFVMFSIFESAILFFPKIVILGCFLCNSRRNHAYRQSKTSKDLLSPWEDEE